MSSHNFMNLVENASGSGTKSAEVKRKRRPTKKCKKTFGEKRYHGVTNNVSACFIVMINEMDSLLVSVLTLKQSSGIIRSTKRRILLELVAQIL